MFGGIPDVISYDMPQPAQLPSNQCDWKLDPARAALLIHDMQGYFLRALAAAESPYRTLVANVADLRTVCANAGVPICYTAQPGGMTRTQRGLLRDVWGDGMSKDAVDREIIPALAPAPRDRVFTKWRYSAFHSSDLLSWLRERERDQLIVCGVYAHVGILVTACESYSHDVETFLPADAVADFTRADHDMALSYAAARCAMVRPTADLIASLRTSDADPITADA